MREMKLIGKLMGAMLVVLCAGVNAGEKVEPTPSPAATGTEGPARAILSPGAVSPRVFPLDGGWLVAVLDPAKKRGPYGMTDCDIVLHRGEVKKGEITLRPYGRIVARNAGSFKPEYALQFSNGTVKVVYQSMSSATSYMIRGEVKLAQGGEWTKSIPWVGAVQFAEGKKLRFGESMCPESLAFVTGDVKPAAMAVCGIVGIKVSLLVRSQSKTKGQERWDAVRRISRRFALNPRGVWLTKDRIALVWIDPIRLHEARVILGVLERSKSGRAASWKVRERREVHKGPAKRVDLVRTGDKVLLVILESSDRKSRVVTYKGDKSAKAFSLLGSMEVAVDGSPVDFAIDSSGKKVAGIMAVKSPKGTRHELFVLDLKPSQTTTAPTQPSEKPR